MRSLVDREPRRAQRVDLLDASVGDGEDPSTGAFAEARDQQRDVVGSSPQHVPLL